jgi:hypothetical protein
MTVVMVASEWVVATLRHRSGSMRVSRIDTEVLTCVD